MKDQWRRAWPGLTVVICLTLLAGTWSGCQTLREVSQLRNVNFAIDRVADARLAGVDVNAFRNYEDIGARDMLRLSAAIADGELPLQFTLHLDAQNPGANNVDARLTQMDWTLLLEDKETISGVFDREVVLPAGETTGIPIDMDLDLVRFFDDNLRELVNLALAIDGDGEPTNVKLRARPTIQTALGPIRYPGAITVVDKSVGQDGQMQ